MGETILNPSTGEAFEDVTRSTDPVILPQPYASPADFSAQYPTPLDTTEILDLCEEVSLLQFLPVHNTALNQEYWREMTSLEFASGSSYIAFASGECPEEYKHDGANSTVTLKNIGAKKTLSQRDIRHSMAIAAASWNGINALNGPFPSSQGLPGGSDAGTLQREYVAGVKEKEMKLAMTLVLNGWDRLLVEGNATSRPLEFDGIENWATNMSCTMHTNNNSASGTFSATSFDRWLAEGCAKPDTLMGHPQTMQEVLSSYFQLGFQGSQVVNFSDGNRITPGFNFNSYVNTGVGRLQVVADNNFNITAAGSAIFQGDVWALRMRHNGDDLIYRVDQFPLSMQDLVPGCTAISFQVWSATALIIKSCCAQGRYRSQYSGNLATTCTVIG